MREIDLYFLNKDEPAKSCLLFLREFILAHHSGLTEAWKYKMPFYYYKGKMFCYLWTDKKTGQPYIGIVDGRLIEHADLVIDKRARMKILIIDPLQDMPLDIINEIFTKAIALRSN